MAGADLIDGNQAVADIIRRLETRRKAKKYRLYRSAVAAVVLLAHLAVIAWLVQTRIVHTEYRKPPPQTQLLWLLLPHKNASLGAHNEDAAENMVRNAYKAVQLLPVVTNNQPNNAITLDPGVALGQALSCGAGKFEYLTPEGQRRCRSKPWNFTYDRNGYVIMDGKGAPKPVEKPHPADVMAHERNTRPVCPKYIDPNVPCLERVLSGGNN